MVSRAALMSTVEESPTAWTGQHLTWALTGGQEEVTAPPSPRTTQVLLTSNAHTTPGDSPQSRAAAERTGQGLARGISGCSAKPHPRPRHSATPVSTSPSQAPQGTGLGPQEDLPYLMVWRPESSKSWTRPSGLLTGSWGAAKVGESPGSRCHLIIHFKGHRSLPTDHRLDP